MGDEEAKAAAAAACAPLCRGAGPGGGAGTTFEGATRFPVSRVGDTGAEIEKHRALAGPPSIPTSNRPGRIPCSAALVRSSSQGLTLVHCSAQRKPFWGICDVLTKSMVLTQWVITLHKLDTKWLADQNGLG